MLTEQNIKVWLENRNQITAGQQINQPPSSNRDPLYELSLFLEHRQREEQPQHSSYTHYYIDDVSLERVQLTAAQYEATDSQLPTRKLQDALDAIEFARCACLRLTFGTDKNPLPVNLIQLVHGIQTETLAHVRHILSDNVNQTQTAFQYFTNRIIRQISHFENQSDLITYQELIKTRAYLQWETNDQSYIHKTAFGCEKIIFFDVALPGPTDAHHQQFAHGIEATVPPAWFTRLSHWEQRLIKQKISNDNKDTTRETTNLDVSYEHYVDVDKMRPWALKEIPGIAGLQQHCVILLDEDDQVRHYSSTYHGAFEFDPTLETVNLTENFRQVLHPIQNTAIKEFQDYWERESAPPFILHFPDYPDTHRDAVDKAVHGLKQNERNSARPSFRFYSEENTLIQDTECLPIFPSTIVPQMQECIQHLLDSIVPTLGTSKANQNFTATLQYVLRSLYELKTQLTSIEKLKTTIEDLKNNQEEWNKIFENEPEEKKQQLLSALKALLELMQLERRKRKRASNRKHYLCKRIAHICRIPYIIFSHQDEQTHLEKLVRDDAIEIQKASTYQPEESDVIQTLKKVQYPHSIHSQQTTPWSHSDTVSSLFNTRYHKILSIVAGILIGLISYLAFPVFEIHSWQASLLLSSVVCGALCYCLNELYHTYYLDYQLNGYSKQIQSVDFHEPSNDPVINKLSELYAQLSQEQPQTVSANAQYPPSPGKSEYKPYSESHSSTPDSSDSSSSHSSINNDNNDNNNYNNNNDNNDGDSNSSQLSFTF